MAQWLNFTRLDTKTAFTEGLSQLRTKLDGRQYTTSLPFARDFSSVFSAGIANEPPAKAAHLEPINIPSPKKSVNDMKARKALAKRIIKAVQPQLEAAVRAEAEISNTSVESLLKELQAIFDAGLQSRRDSISASVGEAISLGDAEGDIEMAGVNHAEQTDTDHAHEEASSAQESENADKDHQRGEDVDMQDEDVDAPHELDDADIPSALPEDQDTTAVHDTIVAALSVESQESISADKPHDDKDASTPPDTNGYVTARQSQAPAPPTPPVSTGGHAPEHPGLINGGVLSYLKEFEPEGTSIVDPQGSNASEDLSDMDEEELRLLGDGMIEAEGQVIAAVEAGPSKSKKAKAKKRRKW